MLTRQFAIPLLHQHLKEILFWGLYGLGLGVLFAISPWLALAGMLGGFFFFILLRRPVYLCYMVILATVFTSGMGRGRVIPYLIPNELTLGMVAAMALPAILLLKRRGPSSSGLLSTGLLILSVGTSAIPLLIYFVRDVSLSVSELFSLVAPLQYILVYLIFRYLPVSETDVRNILRVLLFSGAVVGSIGILQAMRLGFVLSFISTWYGSAHEEVALQVGRVSSILGAWNSLGTFLMVNLLILRAVSVVKPALFSKKVLLVLAAIDTGCLIASGSYASLLGLVLGLLMFEFFDSRGRIAMIILLLCMPILAIPLRESILTRFTFQYSDGGWIPQTLAFRFYVWKDIFWPIIQETWLWGYHPIMPSTLAWLFPESQYFELLLRSGIISLLAHLLWIGLSVVWLFRNFRTHNDLRRCLSASGIILLVVLSIMGLTNGVFTYSGVIEYLWILLCLIGVMGENG
jgi:hypothetical protein